MKAASRELQILFTTGAVGGLPDGPLLERFVARRDEAAFEALVRRHGPMVLAVCRRILRNGHDAEDAFQATFLVLARKAASVVPRERLAVWLYGVAVKTAVKARGMAARRRMRERQVAAMPEAEERSPDRREELEPLIDEELARLPEKFRAPIVLCDLEGKTRRQAAHQLSWPEGTLSSRLARARAMLRQRLSRRGLAPSAGSLAVLLSGRAASASVPEALVGAPAGSAVALAAGGAAAGMISARVTALAEGVLKMMLLTKLKAGAPIMVGLIALGIGVGSLAFGMQAARRHADQPDGEAGVRRGQEAGRGADPPGLRGTWAVVRIEAVSGHSPETLARREIRPEGNTLSFKGGHLKHRLPKGDTMEERMYRVTFDSSGRPPRLTIHAGPHPLRYIYEVEGDTLRLCNFDLEGAGWPAEFSTRKDMGKFPRLQVLRRVTGQEGPGGARKDEADLLAGPGPLAWGEVMGGLRAGIGFHGGRRAYRIGDRVPLVVWVRNVGEEPVHVSYSSARLRAVRPRIEDAQGRPITAVGEVRLVMPPSVRYVLPAVDGVLRPGEEMRFDLVQIALAPTTASGPVQAPELRAAPGEYSIGYTVPMGKGLEVATGTLRLVVEGAGGRERGG